MDLDGPGRTWTDALLKGLPQLVWDQFGLREHIGYDKPRQRCTLRHNSADQFRQIIREIAEDVGLIRVRGLAVSLYPVGPMACICERRLEHLEEFG
jgi:hypothetical protein